MIDESDKDGKFTSVEYARLTKQERDIYDTDKDNIIYAKHRESVQQTILEIDGLLANLPLEIHKGLNEVRVMFWVQFAAGLALLFSAVALSTTQNTVGSLILGGSGAITLVTSLVVTPPLRLQNNRVDLSQWLMAFQRWFFSNYNVDNLDRKEVRKDPSLEIDWDRLTRFDDHVSKNTDTIIRLMEECCQFPTGLVISETSAKVAKTNNKNNKQKTKDSTTQTTLGTDDSEQLSESCVAS